MGFSAVTYALAKKYTDATASQFGALKGAPCQIKDIQREGSTNIITFEWENNNGETLTRNMTVSDGTPIYKWTSGQSYVYSDLVIYQECFYSCAIPNSDSNFNPTKWVQIGSSDSNFNIVQNSSELPTSFQPHDRKMYYSVDDGYFWLWNGTEWISQEPKIISDEDINNLF